MFWQWKVANDDVSKEETMSQPFAEEELPTGKKIFKSFDDSGNLLEETQMYGMLDIGIKYEFDGGIKLGEMYFVKQKLVSRKRYEKARCDYSDMPASDDEVEDVGGELAKAARQERQQQKKAREEHKPNPEVAARTDSFCETMLQTGHQEDAQQWIQSAGHTLGELSHVKSRNLVAKLLKIGAVRVTACDIDQYDQEQNTGHLVVELPSEASSRKMVFREIDRLASQQGYRGDMDNGQRYTYLKLD